MSCPDEEELEYELESLAANARLQKSVRMLALETLETYKAGIIPSRKVLLWLRARLKAPECCERLAYDGSCAWLFKHADIVGLKKPTPGTRAFCKRQRFGPPEVLFTNCPGYMYPK